MPDQFISQDPSTVELSRRGTEQWAIRAVVPGLQKLAESNVRDFYALEKAGKHLPKILHPKWSKRIDEIRATAACMLAPSAGTPASAQRVFICLLKLLNERWFIEMNLFLARYPVRQHAIEGDSLWDVAHVAVHRIVQLRRHRFAEGRFPFVSWIVIPGDHRDSRAYLTAFRNLP
jgi:hypothetical protein